ncbi:MAG: SWIM zinc finger family protein [Desulfuromonadaceae bacterium]
MKELIFFVQGSAKEPYKVTFEKNGNNLSAYCTCPAGDNGQYCKHRFNILGRITNGVVSGNEPDVDVVASWLAGTDVEGALNELMNAEELFEIAKLKLSSAKKQLAKAFRD